MIEVAIAFAGFTTGQAESLRRAMSRKRSHQAVMAHQQQFITGAITKHGVSQAVAERVYAMIAGFSGFGFPKAHGAAFGLLAYQSTWLRVHYGPELLCALLEEQPMGFYPPDALVHEAQRRGIPVLPPDINTSVAGCSIQDATPDMRASRDAAGSAVRIGLGYITGINTHDIHAILQARRTGGPFISVEDLAARAGSTHPTLTALAWSGACDPLITDVATPGHRRRAALWRLGAAIPAIHLRTKNDEHGVQLALPTGPTDAPVLPGLTGWEAMIADYATTTLTTASHPIALLRPVLDTENAASSQTLRGMRHGAMVRVGGLVVARQRPSTANGIVFMLLEDEHGTINLIIPPHVYDTHRLTARTHPLILAHGRLEKHADGGGHINIHTRHLQPLHPPHQHTRRDHRLPAARHPRTRRREPCRNGLSGGRATGHELRTGTTMTQR